MRKTILFSAMAILTITSCQKTPNADFTTDKAEYVAGETIRLTNTSTDAKSYKWTLPDGQTSTAKAVDYTTNDTDKEGELIFKLESFSRNGKKTDDISKYVTLSAAKGSVTFWQKTNSGYDITVVSVNGISSNITSEYDSDPSCGDAGCAVFNNLPVGTYSYSASDGTDNWNGEVTITKDGCTAIELY